MDLWSGIRCSGWRCSVWVQSLGSLGLWKPERSGPEQECTLHPLSWALLINIWRGLQSGDVFWLGEQLVWCCLSHLSLYTSLSSHPWNLPGTVWSFTARTPWSYRATSLQHPRAEWVHFSEMGHFKMPWNSHQKSRRKVVNTLNYSPQTLSRHQCNFIDFSEISVNVGMEMQQI